METLNKLGFSNKRIAKVVVFLTLILLIFYLLAYLISTANSSSVQAVMLKKSKNQPPTNSHLNFDFVNNGTSPIMCPDSWFMEFQDGTVTNISLAPVGDLRVSPGSTGNVSIPKPLIGTRWRLKAFFYEEDTAFDIKVRIDQSSMKNYLPPIASSVRGQAAYSDWIK
ncbi:MAG: hypothetical protein ACFHW5_11880 [Verrucomicrobiota bacterium]